MPLTMPIGIANRPPIADDHQRSDDRVGHAAAGFAHRLRHLREEAEAERRDALRHDVEEHERQRHEREQHGKHAETDDRMRQQPPPAVAHHAAAFSRNHGRPGRPGRPLACHRPDEQPRDHVDDERDGEEHEADLDERVQIQIVGRLGELVGEDRGHRVLRREQRPADSAGCSRSPSSPPSSRRGRGRSPSMTAPTMPVRA